MGAKLPHANRVVPNRFDVNNPRSIINIVPTKMRELLLQFQIKYPELFLMPEHVLKAHFAEIRYAKIVVIDEALRQRFWLEYDRVMESGANRMVVESIFANVMDRELWERYIHLPEKMAWLMCPPALYDAKAKGALNFALQKMCDLLDEDFKLPNGRIDAKLAHLQFQIWKHLEERVLGSTIQRSESRSLNLIATADHKMMVAEANMTSEENLASRLKKLERQERESMHIPDSAPAEEPKQLEPAASAVIDIPTGSVREPLPVGGVRGADPALAGRMVPGAQKVDAIPEPVKPHPDISDPNKNHPKKMGGLVAD